MLHCKVIYFGLIADALGKPTELLDIPQQETPLDLRAFLEEKYPALKNLSWKLAVDQEIVNGPCIVRASSEIVLLPPFAGG